MNSELPKEQLIETALRLNPTADRKYVESLTMVQLLRYILRFEEIEDNREKTFEKIKKKKTSGKKANKKRVERKKDKK